MKNSPKCYILDSYAVLCYLQNEPGAQEVEAILKEAQRGRAKIYITWVNLGEVYYRVWREYGKDEAAEIIELVQAWPVELLVADARLTLAAAAIKAQNRLAYADGFAIAAAELHKGLLVTGDPEIKKASRKLGFEIIWLE
ncbi:MAG TPA: type II toxin-antitoxin system VapC family toxin [Syntrophothermus lipocalidus]|uniref:Ribonuclease VapC n=1 Tax=Syntrophothermus lipocalidus (strain DSM 12680 / TGB-C1) TaxID=643648 RepID=D7CJA0_SYNLT|nr:type II toxin-antitoxin system VapC family toxin [Syntrophothermus lipocalidus]ADI00989.1 PilT protein domain protein [Syntrophothermus lipocalidus DSM 12680]HHV77703.1 type II toxin-antitoxin system VapC family toxin [Syntrophothermus lipocalidus]HOV43381.1 type II toxin-antitoxin system VapC family toxin [Syntrophothermus lipocalidus]